jgi:hypothetical protein
VTKEEYSQEEEGIGKAGRKGERRVKEVRKMRRCLLYFERNFWRS